MGFATLFAMGVCMLIGDSWIIDHLRTAKKSGNTQEGRNWTRRVCETGSKVIFQCDRCGGGHETLTSADLDRMRFVVKRCVKHEERFGEHLCRTCAREEATRNAKKTKSSPEWKAERRDIPSWQSRASEEKLAEWHENMSHGTQKSLEGKTPEERSVGVRKQWRTMSDEVKRNRAKKIGKWARAFWEDMSPEQRNDHIQKCIKGQSRSKVSDEFKKALIEGGVYSGFLSEVAVSGFVVDECNTQRKLVIEFFGDFYHCNPRYYPDPSHYHNTLQMTVSEKWKYDRRRLAAIKKAGFEVLVVWESDWYRNPDEVIQKVRRFVEVGHYESS